MKYDALYRLVLRDSPVVINTKTGKALGFSPSGEYVGEEKFALVLRGLVNIEADDAEAFDTTMQKVLQFHPNAHIMLTFERGYIFVQLVEVNKPAWITGYWVASVNGTGKEYLVVNLKNRKEIVPA